MKYVNTMTVSRMFCTKCGREGRPIPRKAGQQRSAGHLKDLYCPHCKMMVNHAEVRPFGSYTKEDFELEFSLGRFMSDGTKEEIKDLPSCKCTKCRCNINGKCWNSNGNYMQECIKIKAAYADKNEELINKLTGYEEVDNNG